MDSEKEKMNKRGAVVTDLISGTGGLIITTVVILVIVSTLLGANLLTSGTIYANASDYLAGNFTDGLGDVAEKIPTVLLVGAVVLLLGVLVLLVVQARKGGLMGGSASL